MLSRRQFCRIIAKTGIASSSAPLWWHETSSRAFAQLSDSYKALVVVALPGGNDGNNLIVPMDSAAYQEYGNIRPLIAVPQGSCLPLNQVGAGPAFGLHPALTNVASLYNEGNALLVANVGPLKQLSTKAQLLASHSLIPEALLSHPAGAAQWESASTVEYPPTGWGGRIADLISSQSGTLPPVLSAGTSSIFGVGQSVQAMVVSSASTLTVLPSGIDSAILAIANDDRTSSNRLVAEAAKIRLQATEQQLRVSQALSVGSTLATVFPSTAFGQVMQFIAQLINGRSAVGASRQIFYCQQGLYDTHGDQVAVQSRYLTELDSGIGAFVQALQEIGLQNQVLLCTHSDFNRTLLGNGSGGSDHAWGNHQFIIGGGIKGGRILGSIPEPELGGSMDLNGYGTWIPGLSTSQMTAGIGSWMGLAASQLATVFPDLQNFPLGALSLF